MLFSVTTMTNRSIAFRCIQCILGPIHSTQIHFLLLQKCLIMPLLSTITTQEQKAIVKECLDDFASFQTTVSGSDRLYPIICAVCDGIPKHAHWHEWVDIELFRDYCITSRMKKEFVAELYPEELVHSYTVPHEVLDGFVLSPHAIIDRQNGSIVVCKACLNQMRDNHGRQDRSKKFPPTQAICNGYLIGEPPQELVDLNEVELALVSKAQIYCQTWIFQGGIHQQIKGWHTFFKNRPHYHVASLQQLDWADLKGNILVVLCGPFTKTQKALTMKKVMVNPDKVIKAFEWLVQNNIHYKHDRVPGIDEIPIPRIFEENV